MLGPTASGKSAVALRLARRHGAEIVSVDSMQVYRGMDIGTAKPTPAERAEVPHHLVDVAEPEIAFTVADAQAIGRRVLDDLAERDVPALIVGGSGLHFRALVDPLVSPPSDPALRLELEALAPADAVEALLGADAAAGDLVDLENPRRVVRALEIHRLTGRTPSERAATPEARAVRAYESVVPVVPVGLDPGDDLGTRVTERFDRMLERGLVDEVRDLAPRLGPTSRNAVGYRQLLPVVAGERDLTEGRRRCIDATTSLARRQRTFFGRDPRLRWMEWDDDPDTRTRQVEVVLEEAGWTS
ncbi:MAG: tRNA (adenosine(37)-N6)-dimethylallyltransferase MiaA [Acidimicrobiia bacterium]|nr:tRNA (adenosine(37)-N6)-dimethylallyltransferase MiaA [Acidimicrobiia bacterium]